MPSALGLVCSSLGFGGICTRAFGCFSKPRTPISSHMLSHVKSGWASGHNSDEGKNLGKADLGKKLDLGKSRRGENFSDLCAPSWWWCHAQIFNISKCFQIVTRWKCTSWFAFDQDERLSEEIFLKLQHQIYFLLMTFHLNLPKFVSINFFNYSKHRIAVLLAE